MSEEAPKRIVVLPPPIPKEEISARGVEATITGARIATNVRTSLGAVNVALGLTVEIDGEEYSHLFSLDRDVISGSAGRLLSAGMRKIGITSISSNEELNKVADALVGMKVRIVNRGGRLYWYPVD